MPRYDYRCASCGTVFEVTHGMRERPEVSCPDCGGPATRQLNMSSIVFKGSGFYNTDQRGKTGGTAATGTGSAGGDSKSPSSESSSDACQSCQQCAGASAESASAND